MKFKNICSQKGSVAFRDKNGQNFIQVAFGELTKDIPEKQFKDFENNIGNLIKEGKLQLYKEEIVVPVLSKAKKAVSKEEENK